MQGQDTPVLMVIKDSDGQVNRNTMHQFSVICGKFLALIIFYEIN